ncbi:MAG: endonuclease/exonuclease/phosphatase family protein [Candidatus Marinimicrobia bacterium]|nr:endonuclease/exonuclease/phosphatase family protein [Candidatus Neomarinimicrobiota bacterium]
MKNNYIITLLSLTLFISCDPIVNEFPDSEEAIFYTSDNINSVPAMDTITVMTWNIRFGAARSHWFGDACGDRVILPESEVNANLSAVADYLDSVDPDILFLQEIDVESKRTGYVDQVQWLLDNTNFNYGAYASAWQSQFIPSDGLGRMNMGNAVFSKWEITDATRHQISLRGDQDDLTQLFYLRRNVLETKIDMDGTTFYAVNTHSTAFAMDDTKQKHIQEFKDVLDRIEGEGVSFVAGGDLNSLPPGAVKLDYCLEDMCDGESFHQDGDDPTDKETHKEGSWFANADSSVLQGLYDDDAYFPAVPLVDYLANESNYFTHTPEYDNLEGFNRKLDYLWSNNSWVNGSDITHWKKAATSDHLPVSARWEVGR